MKAALVFLWLASALGLASLATGARPALRPVAWLHGLVGLAALGLVATTALRGGWIMILATVTLLLAAALGLALFAAGRRGNPLPGRPLLAHVLAAIVGIVLAGLGAAAAFGED